MKSILDGSFRYTRSADTDLRKTFDRIRRELRQEGRARVEGASARHAEPREPGVHVAGPRATRTS